MITSYEKTKKDVLKCYKDFQQIVGNVGFPRKDDISLVSLKKQAEKIRGNKFCLMVAGEEKSGKSTFINAYLGTEILPMDVRACTSSVIEVRYGEKFVLHATYADGHKKDCTGERDIKDFLINNAALDNEYRAIPTTVITNGIIVKNKDKKVPESIIKDFLEAVKGENIFNLPPEEYNSKIREYIKMKQPKWKDVVTKIDIEYPFEDENMRGIRIIDSPGVNAVGGVGDVTERYIESADAIMFVRPVSGVSPGAKSFKKFLESKSVDRNKNALFIILTRRESENEANINVVRDQIVQMFGAKSNGSRHGIAKEQIVAVGSKAEMYCNSFQDLTTEEITEKMQELNDKNKMESFLLAAWLKAERNKDDFLRELKKYSNFDEIDRLLNRFGRRAQFMAMGEFLGNILQVYEKMDAGLRENLENYKLKAKDPAKLKDKMEKTKAVLDNIELKMSDMVDKIRDKYAGGDGRIATEAEKVMDAYCDEIYEIDAESDTGIDELEKLSFRQIDKLEEFEATLQKEIVDECDKTLGELGGGKSVTFVALKPNFSQEIVDEIKESVRKDAVQRIPYETGVTFKKVKYKSEFSQKRFFNLVKDAIIDEKIEPIKNQAINELRQFVERLLDMYKQELTKNADDLKSEINRINSEEKTAQEIAAILEKLDELISSVKSQRATAEELKGGIDSIE